MIYTLRYLSETHRDFMREFLGVDYLVWPWFDHKELKKETDRLGYNSIGKLTCLFWIFNYAMYATQHGRDEQ